MMRVQAYPQKAAAWFAALFETGSGTPALWDVAAATFAAKVSTLPQYTLAGLGFDPVNGNMVGCWGAQGTGGQFFSDADWGTLTAMVQTMSAKGLVLQAMTVYPDAPSFDDFFQANLAPFVMGYAYAVAKDGQI